MRRNRNVKIVATLGPATSSSKAIRELFLAGVDVFRFNFSHGSHEVHAENYRSVRAIESEFDRPVGVLADLQGPKIRIGRFNNNETMLLSGSRFTLDLDPVLGDSDRVCLPHPEIFNVLEPGAYLLLDDGRLKLKIESSTEKSAETVVEVGGKLSNNKGVNIPNLVLPVSALTEKDLLDLDYALELGADWIALSFVQQAVDIEQIREIIGDRAKIIAKLEKPSAIEQLDDIIMATDAVMVARGDLGVEVSPEQVPPIQKTIIRKCRELGKPVIVATQMLESMIEAPVPTRAEAADVAAAVYEGTDAVMLSGETAVGKHPVATVTMMSRIIEQVEEDPYYQTGLKASRPKADVTSADAICSAMRRVTSLLNASVTVTYTSSGFSTLRAARERPKAPILSLSPNQRTCRYLTLVWGVHSLQSPDPTDQSDINAQACQLALEEDMTTLGQPVIIVSGMPFGQSGTTNTLRIAWPEEQ